MLLPINTMPPCCGEGAPYSGVDPVVCARAAIGTPADAEMKTAIAPANKARGPAHIENNVARMGNSTAEGCLTVSFLQLNIPSNAGAVAANTIKDQREEPAAYGQMRKRPENALNGLYFDRVE